MVSWHVARARLDVSQGLGPLMEPKEVGSPNPGSAPDICRGEMKFQLCFYVFSASAPKEVVLNTSWGREEEVGGPWTGQERDRVFVPTLTLTL